MDVDGIVPVEFPFRGIVGDVLANGIHFSMIADNVLVEIALPKWHTRVVTDSVDFFGGLVCVIGDDLAKGGLCDFGARLL
jgi:hypothetical protein